jgi:hypothetical protein
MLKWETLSYKDQPYVKVTSLEPQEDLKDLAFYYAATPKSLTVTLSESLLMQAIDRAGARKEAQSEQKEPLPGKKPWLGKNLCLQADRTVLDLAKDLGDEDYQKTMQTRSWGNLPILNEWKRRYPKEDPVALHEKHWKTTLVCPGGGQYVWNEEWQTMQSSVYGHPATPKTGPPFPAILQSALYGNFGLTFENQGLRANAVLERQ